MKVKEIKSEGLSHELEVTVPANDIDQRVDAKLKEAGANISLPGFRAGKVPLKLLKQRYGNAIMGEVLEAAVNETSQKALNDKKIKPAMQPKIEVKSKDFGEGQDLVYTMAVDALPEIKVADLKGIKLEKPVAKPQDEDVDVALERIASGNQPLVSVEEKRGAKEGDVVIIDFDGRTADDDVKQPGMAAEGHQLRLGSGQFIPGFEDQLIGKKAGDKVEVKVAFPENYGAADLAGRDAIFDVVLHDIKEPGEAKIDDEFAKTLGMADLKALKEAITEQLSKEFETTSRMNVKKSLLDVLDEKHDFEIPQTMLDMEYDNIIQQLELERQRSGEEAELSKDEKDEYKAIAERRVRLGIVLAEIGGSNNIQVADVELQQAVIAEAQKFPGQEKEVFDYYSKNQQALDSLRAPVYEDKVIDFILEMADVSEKEVSVDELHMMLEEEGEEKPKPKKKAAAKKKAPAKKAAAKKDDAKDEKPAAKKKTPAKKKAD